MILILGSNNDTTSQYYKTLSLSESTLVDSFDVEYLIGHSSPQDAGSYLNLEIIAAKAKEVYFTNPAQSEFSSNVFYYEYLDWLKEFQFKYGTVKNFPILNIDPYNWNVTRIQQPAVPTLQKNDAVFIGCSFTEGVGLTHNSQKYSTQVAEYFGLNCINLAVVGSSNGYLFEVFSKLNFYPGQLVVLQFTLLERLRYCNNDGVLQHIAFAYPPYSPAMLEVYNNKFLFYETLTKLRLVNQIAEARQLKLAVWLDNYKEEHHGHYTKEQQMYFYNMKSFVPANLMQNYFVDVGTDNLHPGPESNRNIAQILINFIEKTYN